MTGKFQQVRIHRSAGFTLIEMVVSTSMLAIIMTALTSAVLLASKALPNGKTVNSSMIATSRVSDLLESELSLALSVTELSANAITFTVADRDNDGSPETIRYAWSGTANGSVTRQYNSNAAVSVLDNVNEWSFLYDRNAITQTQTYTDSSEQLLYSYTVTLLAGAQAVNSTTWFGQVVVPSFSSGVARWRITRVNFYGKADGPAIGESRVQLRTTTSGGLPTATILDQAKVLEANLSSSLGWYTVTMPGQPVLDPSTNYALVFRWVSDAASCDLGNQSLIGALASFYTVKSTNTGSTWTANALGAIPMYIYGITSTRDPIAYKYYLTNVRLAARINADSASRVVTNIRVLSAPQVSAP